MLPIIGKKRANAFTDADLQAIINKVHAAKKSPTNPVFSYCALPTGQGLAVLQRGPSSFYTISLSHEVKQYVDVLTDGTEIVGTAASAFVIPDTAAHLGQEF